MIDNNKQYTNQNQSETIITAQTKTLEAHFRFRFALGPQYTRQREVKVLLTILYSFNAFISWRVS